jgi:hypothetical protein
MQYEQAARFRDRIDRLQLLQDELAAFHSPAQLQNAVYVTDIGGRRMWFLIRGGTAISGCVAPAARATAHRCLQAIERAFFGKQPRLEQRDRSGARIVSTWFRKNPGEIVSLIAPDKARRHCREIMASFPTDYLSQSKEVPR